MMEQLIAPPCLSCTTHFSSLGTLYPVSLPRWQRHGTAMSYSLFLLGHFVVKMEVKARDVHVKVIIVLEVVLDRMFVWYPLCLYNTPSQKRSQFLFAVVVVVLYLTWGRQIGITPSLKSSCCGSTLRRTRSEWVRLLGCNHACKCGQIWFNVIVFLIFLSEDYSGSPTHLWWWCELGILSETHPCHVDTLSIRRRPLVVSCWVDKHVKVLNHSLRLEAFINNIDWHE